MRLDHIHLHVRDRRAACAWMNRVFGLSVIADLAHWADDPGGPLFLGWPGVDGGLALFESGQENRGDHTIAFRLPGRDFLEFLDRMPELTLMNRKGTALARSDVSDHGVSWSVYLADPDGNQFEITSYDYDVIRRALGQ